MRSNLWGKARGRGYPYRESEQAVIAPVLCSVYEIATVVSPQYETLFHHPVHPTAIVTSTRLHGKSFDNVHRYNVMSVRHYVTSNLCRKLYKVG